MRLLDGYDVRARVLPGLTLASPVLVTAYSCSRDLVDLWANVWEAGLVGVSVLAVLAILSRHFGKRAERSLWREWGGPPSRRFIQNDDPTWSAEFKTKLKDASGQLTRMSFPSEEEFKANRTEANRRIDDIFRQVGRFPRQHDPNGLWSIHNREYGAARNLYGSLLPLSVLASVGAFLCIAWAISFGATPAACGAVINVVIAGAALVGRGPFKRHVRDCADRYAESAWTAFLDVHGCRAQSGLGSRRPAEQEKEGP